MVDLHTCSNIQGHISDSDSCVKLVLISAFVFFHVGMENDGSFSPVTRERPHSESHLHIEGDVSPTGTDIVRVTLQTISCLVSPIYEPKINLHCGHAGKTTNSVHLL